MTVNGIIVINKPKGIGSTDCVRIIKRILNEKKVGHSGTLDFMATGVIAICVGKATKIIEYLQNEKKTYIAGIQFGSRTSTLDSEGIILEKSDIKVTIDILENAIRNFKGEIKQIPPMYSALKYKGERLYNLARKGTVIDRKPRTIYVYNISVLNFDYDNQTAFIETTVSSGTYIRTLIDDLGTSIGALAHMISLKRTESCGFTLKHAIDIQHLDKDELISKLIPLEMILPRIDKIYVNNSQKISLLNGMTVNISSELSSEIIKVFDNNEKILGIGSIFNARKGKMLKLKKHLYVDENN